jgi:Mor family transcriptional regulator
VGDPVAEQGLFDDLQEAKNEMESQKPELSEINEADWSDDFEQIEDLIGADAAWKIAEVFAGSTIYIPKSILINKNYFDIRRKYKKGSTYRELSIEFGYSETHIRNIIHKNKAEPKEDIK